MADDNTAELHLLFEDSPVNNNVNWGELNWGPMPQWEQPPPQGLPSVCPAVITAPLTTLAPTKAITMTMRHQTLQTYMVKKFTIISTNIHRGI